MELAIPLVAAGGLYVASRQKENFEDSKLPNMNLHDRNYPSSIDNKEEDYTSQLSAVNKYDGTNAYTDKYFNNKLNRDKIESYSSMGAKNNSGQKFVSLSGEEVNKDYFAHNNMVPFFGGNLKSKNIDATSNEATLDNYVGSGSTYMNKKEQAPLFNPGENYQYAHGAPNTTDFMRSRVNPSNRMANVKPFEEKRVAPGLGLGYTSEGAGGFNAGLMEREKWNAKTVDELRVLTNPRAGGVSALGYEGPANSHIKSMAKQGRQEKNRPERDFEMTQDRLFTTMGYETKPAQRAEHVERYVSRPDTAQSYSGNAGYGNSSIYVDGEHEESHRQTLESYPIGVADANGRNMARDDDYGIQSNFLYPNNRSVAQNDGYFGAFGSAIGAAISPLIDVLKPSRKENTVEAMRPYQNPGARVANSYIFDPKDVPNPTIRETTENKLHFNVNMNNAGRGAYTVTESQPVHNARTKQGDFLYTGNSSANTGTQSTRSYDAEYNQRNNDIKSSTIDGRLVQGNMSLYQGNINQRHNNKDRDLVNKRPIAKEGTKASPSIGQLGRTNQSQPIFQNIHTERNDGNLMNVLQQNPYVIPYMGNKK
jgi:hypothetical protein